MKTKEKKPRKYKNKYIYWHRALDFTFNEEHPNFDIYKDASNVIRFQSIWEYQVYKTVFARYNAHFTIDRQTKIELKPRTTYNSAVSYYPDVIIRDKGTGEPIVYIDAKGNPTSVFKLKMSFMEHLLPQVYEKILIVHKTKPSLLNKHNIVLSSLTSVLEARIAEHRIKQVRLNQLQMNL